MDTDTSSHVMALTFWLVVWLVLLPPFHALALDAIRKRDPYGVNAATHHAMAYVIAAAWPIVLVGAVLKSVRRAVG